jgi:hypothetical protein
LTLDLAEIFIKASFVSYMGAGELQHTLATQGMFQRLFANSALGADECAFPPRATAVNIH